MNDQREHTLGVCLLRTPDDAQARTILDNDPVIKHNVMTGELRRFHNSLHARANVSQPGV